MSEDQLARIPVDEGEAGVDDWQITYGDMVTLLLCFFVLLFSMSTIDPAKFEMTTAALTEQISGEKPLMPIAEVIAELRAAVQRNKLEEEVTISSDGSGVVIEFASSLLFDSARAELNPRGRPILEETIRILANLKYERYGIEVEGHTDDVPIRTLAFPSNWELSAARASSVIRLFIENGIHIKRLRATGYAYTLPKLPNRDPQGKSLPETRASNRRIVIRMYPQTYRTLSTELRAEVERLNLLRGSERTLESPIEPHPTQPIPPELELDSDMKAAPGLENPSPSAPGREAKPPGRGNGRPKQQRESERPGPR